ncbi:MAG TPA: hypothetical protein PK325_07180 [Cyclobacteriaceae bacterium]|nr:hypothetical protein [Cyclobacteriaceae bacterium]HMV09404.1 hypothetical protein [Cyclobacteriaceae bacterium]HMX02425.1 hypothetical protein [Cyclobacteriaceae bacterium]HMX51087.1 hypothetical protein [Cyclobacteriaceae bacterium]HMY91749.1 hypothetical protein [Cyclobacteriaceae bacterium]
MNSEIHLLTFVIDTREKLNQLLIDPAIKYRYNNVKVDTSFIPAGARASKTLNKYFYSCGCGTGGKFVITSLLAAISALAVTHSWTVKNAGLLILVCFLSGLLGKAVGLTYAKYKWKKMVKKLIQLSSSGNGM